jgi:pyruvate ferredoxin oxidoreductase gamma subunit
MIEVKFLGRGGYGCVSSARILGIVAVKHELWASSVPRFGAERRGAPVHADVRISKTIIRDKSFINQGDMTIILNQGAFSLEEVISHTKSNGLIVLNGNKGKEFDLLKEQRSIVSIEATLLARKQFNTTFANIIILGGVFSLLGLDDIEIIKEGVREGLPTIDSDHITQMTELGLEYGEKWNISLDFEGNWRNINDL